MLNFDTSNAMDMSSMFGECKKIKKLNLSNFNIAKYTDVKRMFYKCENLKELYLNWERVQNASDKELIDISKKCGVDIRKYIIR